MADKTPSPSEKTRLLASKTPSPSEKTRLLASSSNSDQKSFYFAPRRLRTGSQEDSESGGGGKKFSPHNSLSSPRGSPNTPTGNSNSKSLLQRLTSSIFGSGGHGSGSYSKLENREMLAAKPRKVPVKVEPKVFFANERTFLAWLHMSVTLASISVAIVAFSESNEWSQIYGLLLMPVAIAFSAYSLYMYIQRASLIRRKEPGPYEDKVGPIFLACLLALSITVNFLVKLYDMAT